MFRNVVRMKLRCIFSGKYPQLMFKTLSNFETRIVLSNDIDFEVRFGPSFDFSTMCKRASLNTLNVKIIKKYENS